MAKRLSQPLPKGAELFLDRVHEKTRSLETERWCREALESLCHKLAQKGMPVPPGHLTHPDRLLLFLMMLAYRSDRNPLQYKDGCSFKFEDLKDIAAQAESLIKQIEWLKQTPLILSLQLDEKIPRSNDVLAPAGQLVESPFLGMPALERIDDSPDPFLDTLRAELGSVLKLPDLAKPFLGKKQRGGDRGVEDFLERLFRFLKDNTGEYCEKEIVDILRPFSIPYVSSEEAVRQWRTRRTSQSNVGRK
jgi:hypothetical protein